MRAAARQRLAGKAKPPGSLGVLEDWAAQLAELQDTTSPRIAAARALVFAADHGLTRVSPGVSAYPRSVTPAMFGAIARGQAACNVLAAQQQCSVVLCDVGIDADVSHVQPACAAGAQQMVTVLHRKVARGSQPFRGGAALTQAQCAQAMAAGAEAVALAAQQMAGSSSEWRDSQGALVIGELGIGNTTAAAALLAALCPTAMPEEVCGRGTGVDDAGLKAKQAAVAAGLAANADLIASGPLGALAAVGGLELAAMTGAILAAAERSMPTIVDGFVCGAAALAAVRHKPEVARCLFVSHQSAEAGAQRLLQELGCGSAVLQLGMRLGEGTGALLALPLLRSAAAILTDMAALEDVLAATV